LKLDPDIITSLGEFERVYGDGQKLKFGDLEMDNFMWHAARAFFTEGGKRLYVSRVFRGTDTTGANPLDGAGSRTIGGMTIRARYPGAYGKLHRPCHRQGRPEHPRIGVDENGQRRPTLGALFAARHRLDPRRRRVATATIPGDLFIAERDPAATPVPWKFSSAAGAAIASPLTVRTPWRLRRGSDPGLGDSVRVITLTVEVWSPYGESLGVWADLPIDPTHATGGLKDSVFDPVCRRPRVRCASDRRDRIGGAVRPGGDGRAVRRRQRRDDRLRRWRCPGERRRSHLQLGGGDDGLRPELGDYEGKADPDQLFKTGIKQFEALEDISIVAAPGSTWNYTQYRDNANAITGLLIAHATNMRYRIAVLDSRGSTPHRGRRSATSARCARRSTRSTPPSTTRGSGSWTRSRGKVISLPPSGFVCGIYARNDINRACVQGAGERSGESRARVRHVPEQEPAGGAQSRRHQLLPVLRGPRNARLGRADDLV
jgi:hypothetical protein